ncbi:hypothetical protein ElyMa_005175000 [Elysia marginata]|uniref:Uncharacterized protein n=1 Tax=Elysia marginata TaxID=1093978 RepID=A0AAV4JUS3_9GAST|nr:hypothetical protein ElyMa_005175000 [Elysia marginata]
MAPARPSPSSSAHKLFSDLANQRKPYNASTRLLTQLTQGYGCDWAAESPMAAYVVRDSKLSPALNHARAQTSLLLSRRYVSQSWKPDYLMGVRDTYCSVVVLGCYASSRIGNI